MKLIVGLGNPGDIYKNNRHNIGFLFLDYFVKKNNLKFKFDKKFNSEIIKDLDYFFVKPQAFMNNSGFSIKKIFDYYNFLADVLDFQDNLIVIHDELDLDFGNFKISYNSGSAGHNGVKSIIDYLDTKKFTRVRIGISNENRNKISTDRFVLNNFSDSEKNKLLNIFQSIEKKLALY